MAWKMSCEPKVLKLTRTLAEKFSNMPGVPHDRPLNPLRTDVLKTAVDFKKFRTCEWASVYCAATKSEMRANGKHTSTLFSQMNGDFPKDLHVIIEKYHADTMDDVADLYSTFDTRASVRTTGDINMIYSAICPELADVSSRIVNAAVSGLSYAIWEDGMHAQPAQERAKLIVPNAAFCLWLNEIVGTASPMAVVMRRASVVAAMSKTWNKSHAAATEFWTAVRDESGAKPDAPDRKIGRFLRDSRLHAGSKAGTRAGRRETYVKCIHAWNAWRGDSSTSLAYFADAKTPSVK